MALIVAVAVLAPTSGYAQREEGPQRSVKRVTQAEREAAATRKKAKGFKAPKFKIEPLEKAKRKPAANAGTVTSAIAVASFSALAMDAVSAALAVPGTAPHYFSVANYANSPLLRKFVDELPGLGAANANNLGQYIPVAVPDTTTYPGSDYYEIAVVDYEEQMHSDLPPTRLRGYVQLSTSLVPGARVALSNPDSSPINLPSGARAFAVAPPHYLGPAIVSAKDRPVRILFRNLLRPGEGGNLFIPVDTTVMGSGIGPDAGMDFVEPNPQRPICGELPKDARCYSENRAVLHMHGGITPWISDGTPHQWITPANDPTPYKTGVSMQNVPDMPDPGPGAQTYFYTNQQSARLLFYHDHSWGITRLNVYAGEVAPYLITDPTEAALVAAGTIPGAADTIPLVVQDKTFVPSLPQLEAQDPTWDIDRWGGPGSLWLPHVYVPAQSPGDSSGVNEFGRWAYGPWFWPPTNSIDFPPIPNPYYDDACNPDLTWCEPPLMPGTPFVSMGMEAFHDTPLVNGTAYPVLNVDPKSYRFRVLNGASDRSFNLSIYRADASGTEVPLNPEEVAAALEDSTVFPTPVAGSEGPSWIQIGTEGGFLPSPVVVPPQVTTWVNDPTVFNAGNVDQHSLLLAPAERADVIVDFSAFAGQTLILYNDAPAAFPARDPRYDYYTGNGDYTDTGGTPPTAPGYGPNMRTVMKIVVANTAAAPAFDIDALNAAFAHKADGSGVFESSQNPIVVGQGAYNLAYGTTWQNNGPRAGLVQIFDEFLTFDTLAVTNYPAAGGKQLRMPLIRKAIQDEMGEAFDKEYGRMSGNLGLEAPNVQAGTQQKLVLYPFVNPATEVMDGIELPPGVEVTPIADVNEGAQMWKITHNGVDTHPIHFHLFDVQLVNRVGWDGIIRKPEPTELGWKDTVRISPLEDTIVVMRPIIPKLPFGVPDSVRPLNPMMPLGSTAVFNNTDAFGNPISPAITNVLTNFGWEYVWHCHILSHEEMDMMRPIAVSVETAVPNAATTSGVRRPDGVEVSWTDSTPPAYLSLATWGDPSSEIGFRIMRATGASGGTFSQIAIAPANTTRFLDTTAAGGTYRYQVIAYSAFGPATFNTATVGTTVVPYTPATGVTLTSSLQSPQVVNTAVTFVAQGEGSTGTYQYRFEQFTGGTWQIVQAFGTSSTWTFQPANAGTYSVRVAVRVGTTGAAQATSAPVDFTFNPVTITPATGVILTPSPASPQVAGTAVTFTAQARGTLSPAEYRFWMSDGGAWQMVQDYGVGSSWVLQSATAGNYSVAAWVRTTPSVEADAYGDAVPFTFTSATVTPATDLTLDANPTSPSAAGTSVVFTANGSGSTTGGSPTPPAGYQYRFFVDSGAGWVMVQDYGISSTYTLTTPTAGTYQVAAWVRTTTGVPADVYGNAVPHSVTGATPTPATGVTLGANPLSPSPAGTSVVFTATGSGSTTGGSPTPAGTYQYRFWVNNGSGWVMTQDYGVGSTYTLTTPAAGTYQVAAWVRTTNDVEADFYGGAVTQVVGSTPTPATGVTVDANPTSPSSSGTSVVFTATGSGSTTGGSPTPGATYQYRFWVNDGSGWVMVQDYGVGSTYTLTTPVVGVYQVAAWVRTTNGVEADFYGDATLHTVQ